MSLNLQPGQTWRNRSGAFVTVEYKASERSWYLRHESDNEHPGYLVDAMGKPIRGGRSDLALVERAERVYISVHGGVKATAAQAARDYYRKRGCWVTGTSVEGPQQSLRSLIECETLVLLNGFTKRDFPHVEKRVAESLSMTVIYPEDY